MMKSLLIRGMIAGAVAGLVAFGFARVFGEPEIEYAIAFEAQASKTAEANRHAAGAAYEQTAREHAAAAGHDEEEELFSRGTQRGIGLLTAVVIYGAGIGGLFAIAFAFAYGRFGDFGPAAASGLLAMIGFVSVALVPFLKYPANPPGVGNPETLGLRASLFLMMIAISLIAILLAVQAARFMASRAGRRSAMLLGGVTFAAIIGAALLFLPELREQPEQFSADALWRFRAAAIGTQFLIWATIGIVFGVLSTRLLNAQR